jgi:hypothetical protein
MSFKSSHHICTKHKIFQNLKMDKKWETLISWVQ